MARDSAPGGRGIVRRVIRGALEAGIPFAVGGFHALAAYTGQKRKSKDLDLYVLPSDRKRMIALLNEAGLSDYYRVQPYDRSWIYRSHLGGVIVDVIWAMANHRTEVDRVWLEKGREIRLAGRRLRVLPPEESLWTRLYILQRDRCDWPDVLNLIAAVGTGIDWEYLAGRLGEDLPLLAAVLCVFAWLDPARASRLPSQAWRAARLPVPKAPGGGRRVVRSALIDTRRWYVGSGKER